MKQFVFASVLLAAAVAVFAQQPSPIRFSFNHLALSVKDVDRSAGFYQSVLQLQEITNRTKMEGIRWFSLGEGKELHLISTLKQPVSLNKAVHLALTTTDFDRFLADLTQRAVPYSDWPGKPQTVTIRADGVKQLYLQDPDGYWIEVNSAAATRQQ